MRFDQLYIALECQKIPFAQTGDFHRFPLTFTWNATDLIIINIQCGWVALQQQLGLDSGRWYVACRPRLGLILVWSERSRRETLKKRIFACERGSQQNFMGKARHALCCNEKARWSWYCTSSNIEHILNPIHGVWADGG